MYISINLPKHVINLYRFCSKDESRPNLQNVCIELQQGKSIATAVATDGHRLVYLQFDTGDVQPETESVFIAGKVLKTIKLGKDGVAVLQLNHIICTVKGVETRIAAGCDADAFSYMQWRNALPKSLSDNTAVAKIGVNSRFLADFADYLKACGAPEGITLEIPSDVYSPMTLTAHVALSEDNYEKTPIHCIVMPMRP